MCVQPIFCVFSKPGIPCRHVLPSVPIKLKLCGAFLSLLSPPARAAQSTGPTATLRDQAAARFPGPVAAAPADVPAAAAPAAVALKHSELARCGSAAES